MRLLALCGWLFCALSTAAQESVLTTDEFLRTVLENHPEARSARLMPEMGDRTVQKMRGGFDPVVEASWDYKQNEGTEYYDIRQGTIYLPTASPITLKGGVDWNDGEYLNPQNQETEAGLGYVGAEIALGAGLLTDAYRTGLADARLYRDQIGADAVMRINKLIYDALDQYYQWSYTRSALRVFQQADSLARERLRFVVGSFELGDVPAIDTVEASLQVQSRAQMLASAELDFLRETREMQNFLFTDTLAPSPEPLSKPLAIADAGLGLIPDKLEPNWERHPAILSEQLGIDRMDVNRRWYAEQLKPVINLQFNPLTAPLGNEEWAQLNENNYKAGAYFRFPLFLRKERGQLELMKLDILEARNSFALNRTRLQNAWQNNLIAPSTLGEQVALAEQMVINSLRMLEGERAKFENGESSLFLVNAREVALIEAQLDLYDLYRKLETTRAEYFYLLGNFPGYTPAFE